MTGAVCTVEVAVCTVKVVVCNFKVAVGSRPFQSVNMLIRLEEQMNDLTELHQNEMELVGP